MIMHVLHIRPQWGQTAVYTHSEVVKLLVWTEVDLELQHKVLLHVMDVAFHTGNSYNISILSLYIVYNSLKSIFI